MGNVDKQMKKVVTACVGCYGGIAQELRWGRAGLLNAAVVESLGEETAFQHEGQEAADKAECGGKWPGGGKGKCKNPGAEKGLTFP